MNTKLLLIILVLNVSLSSCSERELSDSDTSSSVNCDDLSQEQDYTTLTGTLVISPNGDFVFRAITDDSLGIACPTFLTPCGNGNNDYVKGQYHGYSSVRDLDDDFWISISGKYVNLDEYLDQDENFDRLTFIYDWVAIVDTPKKIHAFKILDSINAIDQNDLIKINSGRCVNNCLPKESFFRLTNLRQALNKIEFDIVWQIDSLNYKLVQFVE
ncbi:hypothetical protein [Parvicella tangerina]|uniref:hypothetical protein n=1 Tax=Parvicella tangerina TaxID=2829795 RepID=UPI00215D3F0C|nr:hypothetical protein [Parvicella tangerina]